MAQALPLDPKYTGKKKKKIELLIERVLVGLCLPLLGKARNKHPDDVKSVLLIRSNAMGDAVVASAFIHAALDVFPHARVDVLASPYNREVFSWIPQIGDIHVLPDDDGDKWKLARRLRGRYDIVFQTLFDENYLTRTLLARVIAGRNVVVARQRWTPMEQLADHIVPLPAGCYVGKLLALLTPFTPMDVEALVDSHPHLRLELPQTVQAAALAKLAARGLRPQGYIALNISARVAFRALGTGQAKDMARRLAELGHPVLVCCDPADRERALEVARGVSNAHVVDFASLGEAMTAVRHAKLYLGPDTGSVHFAASGRVPCVVLFANTALYEAWSPYGTAFVSIQANPGETVQDIDAGFVMHHVEALLDQPQGQTFVRPLPKLYPRGGAAMTSGGARDDTRRA